MRYVAFDEGLQPEKNVGGEDGVFIEDEKCNDNFLSNINADKTVCMNQDGSTSEPSREKARCFVCVESQDVCAETDGGVPGV